MGVSIPFRTRRNLALLRSSLRRNFLNILFALYVVVWAVTMIFYHI